MTKKINLPADVSITDWIDENRSFVMDTLYDNVFDFILSGEEKRVVLEVVIKQNIQIEYSNYDGLSMDFIITKEHMNETIDKLITHYETIELYEKCSELIKLKK